MSAAVEILANKKQQNNPILLHLKPLRVKFISSILSDFVLSPTTCAFFLSLQFHLLKPTYIFHRVNEFNSSSNKAQNIVLLILMDTEDDIELMKLTKYCSINNLKLILCFSNEEVGKYLKILKKFSGAKSKVLSDLLKGSVRGKKDEISFNHSKIEESLTSIKQITKKDIKILLRNFNNLRNILNSKNDDFILCPGIGEKKSMALHKVFNDSW